MTTAVAALLVAALYALHQDIWFWREARPLVFGFLPIGLFYHVGLHARDLGRSCGARAAATGRRTSSRTARRANDSRGRRLRLPRGRAVHRHLRVPRRAVAAPTPRTIFLAGRSLGPAVFLLSLFGANMTAFSILGASGHAFANGIVTYGLMASSSALVIPADACS